MKKLFMLLAVAGLISFAACKSGETKSDANADSTEVMASPDSLPVAAQDTTVK